MDIRGVDLSAGRLLAVSASMDVFFPGREPLSNGGGGGGGYVGAPESARLLSRSIGCTT